ncbi:MAG: aldo/keto reductase [Acutalibacteraceae bacterium]|nr:aldo/keto reductase [Acutalibacteraceae bacterium]
MNYKANDKRYNDMVYRRCGRSGLKLPAISLGLWQNFGSTVPYESSKERILRAFDLGITHFDLANNYGPVPGSAELTFGKVMHDELRSYRDELVISTKAGYGMWSGPYGDWGSKKYLISSLDQSLSRMGLDYVDIFYHHRFDPETPLEETVEALEQIVRSGKALYVGVSNYNGEQAARAAELLEKRGIHLLIVQPCYSMLNRAPETDLFPVLEDKGIGSIAYCPLAQGLLTSRYLNGVPSDSRAAADVTLKSKNIDDETLNKIRALSLLAVERDQSMAQLALSWALRSVTSVIIGASKAEQIEENVGALKNLEFSDDEINRIEKILGNE